MNNKDRDFICWLAGFYEGEGSCGFYHNLRYKGDGTIHLTISQNEITPLKRIQEYFGFGSIVLDKRKRCHSYGTSGINVITIFNKILPFIISNYKRNQALEAINNYFNREKEPRRNKKYTQKSLQALLRKRNTKGNFI
jgi:hypothetical protein